VTTVLLVRHSMSTGGIGDAGLSDTGWALARRAAARLTGPRPARVFTSPLRRARETAQCFADRFPLPVSVDDRLRERENWGDLPGESWDDFVERWERCNVERDFARPTGISSREAGDRVDSFVREVASADRSTVLAVSHGGAIVDFLLNVFPAAELAARKPDYREMVHCALTEIDVRPDAYVLERFADPILIE
jgi:broad specificity phosphatase PhoE